MASQGTAARAANLGACPDCGKLRYPSRRQAKQAARQMRDRNLRAYPSCGGYYHLTSMPAVSVQWHRERGA